MAEEACGEDFRHVGGLRARAAHTHHSEAAADEGVGGRRDKNRGWKFHNSPSVLTVDVMTERLGEEDIRFLSLSLWRGEWGGGL